MKIYGFGQRGPDKTIGEDHMLIKNGIISEGYIECEPDEKTVLAICDGVGGNNAGEEASLLAVKGLVEARLFEGTDEQSLRNIIKNINDEIITLSAKREDYSGMATTMTGVYIDKEKGILFHLGNCRLFAVNGAYLRQVTEDHTNVNKWVRMGVMTRDEAEDRPDKNVIYACLGGGNPDFLKPLEITDITETALSGKDLILTSDGIHDHVKADDMEEIMLSVKPMKERMEKLTSMARENGSKDDISIIYFER